MTDEERERARAEIMEHFGAGVGDILRRAREARERQAETHSLPQEPEESGSDRNDAVQEEAAMETDREQFFPLVGPRT
jgi:hypothetical protein